MAAIAIAKTAQAARGEQAGNEVFMGRVAATADVLPEFAASSRPVQA
jgi:hypothetical protein